ncbi:MAG: serine hydrolase domain-containing protein, partial [Pirellulales bacterium]
KRDTILYQHAFGFANREWEIPNTIHTKFRLASVSKQFCSMLVMQLVEEGRLSLDDTLSQHLPYYRSDTGSLITIHHLLSHQSGLKDFPARFDYRSTISKITFGKDEFIKLYCSADLLHEPGTLYSYCNAGYCILGRIIERVTGTSYKNNLSERILKPTGMHNSGLESTNAIIKQRASGYTRGPFGVENAEYLAMASTPGAAGAVYSTVGDLFLWNRALSHGTLLNKENMQRMFAPNRDVPEVQAAGGRPHSIYGYGWNITTRRHPITKNTTRVIYHGGAINGFRAMETRLVDDDAVVIVLCNQGDATGNSEVWDTVQRLSTELIHITTGQPFRMPTKAPIYQDQRVYQLVRSQGAQAALDWFQAHGKKAAWGGSLFKVSEQLLKDGYTDDALTLLEFDAAMTPDKVWLLRKTAQSFFDAGKMEKALLYAEKGLAIKPTDERLLAIQLEATKQQQE